MPLQNRVDPFGEIRFSPARGLLFGNRGGRFHNDDKTLSAARWKSRRWIVCVCEFRGRRKEVFGPRYTDLFFLDEPTAFAAGHRPCFECRRTAALAYRAALGDGAIAADEIDRRLDGERRDGRMKRLHLRDADALPDGAIYADGDACFALRGDRALRWSFEGYGGRRPRPRGPVEVLTPPTSLAALSAGYTPLWHSSAG